MTSALEAPPDGASKDVTTSRTVPIELRSKTSAQISAQIALIAQLEAAASLLIGAREELAAAKARVGTNVPVFEDDGRGRQVQIAWRELGPDSAGVPKAQQRIEQIERDTRVLEGGIWDVDLEVLELARAIAGEREALPPAQLRAEADRIEAGRTRRREELAESEALLAAAQRERADVDDPKDLARLEVLVARRTREGADRREALRRTIEETEAELTTVRSALGVAEGREAEEREANESAERDRQGVAAVRRVAQALDDLIQAEAELGALRPDLLVVSFSTALARSREIFTPWARSIGALDDV
jgi:hypothetical protein